MTAKGENERPALLERGFTGCIFKPFSANELLKHLSSIMDNVEVKDEIELSVLLQDSSDKFSLLEKIIESSRTDMAELQAAVKIKDREKLRETIHRIYPLWEMLGIHGRLQRYRKAVADSACDFNSIILKFRKC